MAGVDDSIETITMRARLLRQQWSQVRDTAWHDRGAADFEQTFVDPLERQTRATLGSLAALSRVIAFAERSAV